MRTREKTSLEIAGKEFKKYSQTDHNDSDKGADQQQDEEPPEPCRSSSPQFAPPSQCVPQDEEHNQDDDAKEEPQGQFPHICPFAY